MLIVPSRLGENHFTLSAQYNFLADRVNADDYDSSLVTAILQVCVSSYYYESL